MLPSHVGDGATVSTLAVACCCVILTMALPSVASDGAAEPMLAVM
jgi:hypothetical protein